MSTRRYAPGAPQRTLAILGALGLLLALLPLTTPAAASEHLQEPDSRGIDEACALVDLAEHDFEDLAGFSAETRQAIRCAAAYGIAQGYDADRYRPGLDIQRYQMALLLERLAEHVADTSEIELPAVADQEFTDIGGLPEGHQDAINLLGTLGVTTGTGDGSTFAPHAPVDRRDMASFIVRLQENLIEEGSYGTGNAYFPDVTDTLARAGDINALAERGIAEGRTDGTFGPRDNVRRGEMALFVLRHVDENVTAGRIPGLVPTTDVTILHDTHLHGSFGDLDEPANIATYSALVRERKEAREHALFVGNGDEIAPSVMSSVFRGQHMIDALNASPLDVTTMGNHEFDYGPDNLADLLEESEFQWVSANVIDTSTDEVFGADLGVEPFVIEELGDVSVGITGLGPEGMAGITSLGDDVVQVEANEALDAVIPEMEAAGADVIVLASHLCGPDARDLADARDDVDAIVGDHCSEVLDEPELRNGTIVALVGDEYDHLGELTLRMLDGELVRWHHTRHDLADLDIEPDPEVAAVVEDYEAELDQALSEVIGERSVAWDTRTSVVRSEETGIGNFIADAMRDHHGTDVAIQNSGGIRSDQVYEPGEITRLEVVQILPFDNYVVEAEVQGDVLLEALEHSVHGVGDGVGRFLQVSGIELTYDPDAEPYERVTEVEVGGEPLDEDATYTLATNDFTLAGGDDFDMLAEHAEVIVDADAGPLLSQMVMDTIEAMDQPVDTGVEGRINRLGS